MLKVLKQLMQICSTNAFKHFALTSVIVEFGYCITFTSFRELRRGTEKNLCEQKWPQHFYPKLSTWLVQSYTIVTQSS